ncbi:hypothetical protein FACS189472_16760 [Alphaproteobacteria bacterium]|nr:hypothetical protein FACS189472_16760 [Alphaproteobacteria bacterium]
MEEKKIFADIEKEFRPQEGYQIRDPPLPMIKHRLFYVSTYFVVCFTMYFCIQSEARPPAAGIRKTTAIMEWKAIIISFVDPSV